MALRRQRLENFEFEATWSEFKATRTTGQGPREKAGSWEGEGGRETEIHTDRGLPEKPEERVWPYLCSLKPHELPDKE